MNLREYFDAFPRGLRGEVRRRLAAAHGVAEVTVRAWANGRRRHPADLEAIRITEAFTGLRVGRRDLRPDVFGTGADG